MSVDIRMARGLLVHVDVPATVRVEGGTAREAVDALILAHPSLRQFVLDDARRLRQHVNIYVNNELIHDRQDLSDPVADGDRLHILPAVSGGTVDISQSHQHESRR